MPRAHASIQRSESSRGGPHSTPLRSLGVKFCSRRSSEPFAQYGKSSVIVFWFWFPKNLTAGDQCTFTLLVSVHTAAKIVFYTDEILK